MKPGIYPNLSNEEYHADRESYSRSALMAFKRAPYHYWAEYLNPARPAKEATPTMIFGSAFHTYVLEPEIFENEYDIGPPKILLKDVGREAFDLYKVHVERIEKSTKKIIPYNDAVIMKAMMWSLRGNRQAWELIQGAKYEQSYFWEDRESGLIVKARPDILHPNMIVDLKTCADASPRGFQNAMASGGYHIQGSMVREAIRELEGRDIPNVINICIEKTYPYSIGIYLIDEEALEIGRLEFKGLLTKLNHAIMHNDFPGYETQTITLPGWYKYE